MAEKNIPDSDIGIAGYNVVLGRISSKAGGVVIFTKEHLQCSIATMKEMENKPPSSHLPDSLVIEDTVVTGNERIAELFNQHFVKCGNLFDSLAPPKPPTNSPPPSPSSAAP
ncbi:hypothetical protein F7725_009649, partial [Dissostichus mawsoni]